MLKRNTQSWELLAGIQVLRALAPVFVARARRNCTNRIINMCNHRLPRTACACVVYVCRLPHSMSMAARSASQYLSSSHSAPAHVLTLQGLHFLLFSGSRFTSMLRGGQILLREHRGWQHNRQTVQKVSTHVENAGTYRSHKSQHKRADKGKSWQDNHSQISIDFSVANILEKCDIKLTDEERPHVPAVQLPVCMRKRARAARRRQVNCLQQQDSV